MQMDVAMNVKEEGEQRHLLQEMLPIIAQEDPYMIRLFGQQKYIEIVKITSAGWAGGVSLPFFLLSMNVLVNMVNKETTI
jgi:hypothetical protein